MIPFRTILYPTDFSELADHAFPVARSLARDHGAALVILHVYPPPIAHGEEVARRSPDDFLDDLWEALHRYEVPEGTAVTHRLAEGMPAEQIVQTARELNCDLIVLGTHGRTGLRRLLMGSVAEHVLRQAPCAVVTVGPPGREAAAPPEA